MKKCLMLSAVVFFSHCQMASAQQTPPSEGVSYDDALKQAQALLKQQDIDPTGLNSEHHESKSTPNTKTNPTFAPLSLDAVRQNPDVWPAKVLMQETVDFSGGLTLRKGEPLSFMGFDGSGELYLDYGEYQLTLPANLTDFLQRANDIARGKAKSEGYRGRLVEQLNQTIYVKEGNSLRRAGADEIAGADFYLFYHSSQACRWSGRFTPDLVKTVQELEAKYPGKIQVIYVSADRNMAELQGQLKTVGAEVAMPPMPKWYIDTFSLHHPNVRQINQPSFMLMNANGRLLDSGMRRDDDYSSMFQGLAALPEKLANSPAYTPAWMRLESTISDSKTETPHPSAAESGLHISSNEIIENSDPTIAGPEPYTTTLRDGTEVPGLVLYDRQFSGNRIPALTLQAFPANQQSQGYYVLSFRQVLGKTYGSKPLLVSWFRSVTHAGEQAQEDLLMLVKEYKAMYSKFQAWRQTAIDNKVSNFEKQMYVMPLTQFHHPAVLAQFAVPGRENKIDTELAVTFKVFDDPSKASFKGARWSLSHKERDAFERLIPQIDSLVSQMKAEILRTASAKQQREDNAKDTDALFQ